MLEKLHEAIAQVCPIDGISDNGDGSYRIDFKDEATPEQRDEAMAIAASFVEAPEPKWQQLLGTFQFPGNPLYLAVLESVALSGFGCQDHWGNFKLLLSTPMLQSVEALAASINQLATLLDEAGHPLSPASIDAWNQMMIECDFPESCHLVG